MAQFYEILKKERALVSGNEKPATSRTTILEPEIRPEEFPSFFRNTTLLRDFYILKENLATIRNETGKKIFAFTGPRAGVGVSSIVATLAFVWAKSLVSVPGDLNLLSGKRILVMDVNVTHPSLHRFFNLSHNQGLSEFLKGQGKINRLIARVPGNNLFILPLGKGGLQYEDAFASTRFIQLVQLLSQKFDAILVDTPPVLNQSESIPLIKIFRNYLLVIDAQNTRTSIAKKAVDQLNFYGAEVLGVVMNRRKFYVPEKIYQKL